MTFPQNILDATQLDESHRAKLLSVFNSLDDNYTITHAFAALSLDSHDSHPGCYYYAIRKLTKVCSLIEVQDVLGGPTGAMEVVDLLQNLMDFFRVCDSRDFEYLMNINAVIGTLDPSEIDELHHQKKQDLIERLNILENQTPL